MLENSIQKTKECLPLIHESAHHGELIVKGCGQTRRSQQQQQTQNNNNNNNKTFLSVLGQIRYKVVVVVALSLFVFLLLFISLTPHTSSLEIMHGSPIILSHMQ